MIDVFRPRSFTLSLPKADLIDFPEMWLGITIILEKEIAKNMSARVKQSPPAIAELSSPGNLRRDAKGCLY